MRVMVIPVVNSALGMVSQRLGKKTREIENQKKNWDHPDHCIVKIG